MGTKATYNIDVTIGGPPAIVVPTGTRNFQKKPNQVYRTEMPYRPALEAINLAGL